MSLPDGSIKRSTEIKTVVFRMLASLPSGVGVSGGWGKPLGGLHNGYVCDESKKNRVTALDFSGSRFDRNQCAPSPHTQQETQ
jgi:hypothetical protein